MSKGTIYTIILSGGESVKFRELVSEYYDVIVKTHHSPDGEQLYCDLELHPKDSLPTYKPPKRKRNYTKRK